MGPEKPKKKPENVDGDAQKPPTRRTVEKQPKKREGEAPQTSWRIAADEPRKGFGLRVSFIVGMYPPKRFSQRIGMPRNRPQVAER